MLSTFRRKSRGLYYLWYVNMINKTYYTTVTKHSCILYYLWYVQHDQWVCFKKNILQ